MKAIIEQILKDMPGYVLLMFGLILMAVGKPTFALIPLHIGMGFFIGRIVANIIKAFRNEKK